MSWLRKISRKIVVIMIAEIFLFFRMNGYCLPEGMQVESGSVSVETPDAATMNITAGDKAIINFNSFNIGTNEAVNFIQPAANSTVLSRVVGNQASQINGTLTANGILFLTNPNGINFGATANVQVNSMIASTLEISTNNFINGNYVFDRNSNSVFARIMNEGIIEGNNIALVASAVENRGIITARAGTVNLAAGDKTTVSIDARGLINIEINEAVSGKVYDENGVSVKDAVKNSGSIEGVQVYMSAKTADEIFERAVNTSGIVKATKIVEVDGVIKIVANGDINISGQAKSSRLVEITSEDFIGVSGEFRTTGDTKIAAGKDIEVNADIVVEAGDLELTADSDLDGVGAFKQASGAFITTTDGDITIQSSGESTIGDITSAGDLVLKQGGAAAVYTQHSGSKITTLGSFTINPGVTLKAADTEYKVGRDWINLGMFEAESSMVSLVSLQEARVIGSNEFNDFTISEADKIVRFESEQTQTIRGILTLRGEYGKLLVLGSTEPGKQWAINPQGQTDIAYTLVGDSINIRGPPLKAIHTSSAGNLTNWDTDPYWTGEGVDNNWSTSDNWDTGTVPTQYDIVTFDGITGNNPNKNSIIDELFQGTIAQLTIDGYLGIITLQRDLTITGDITLASGVVEAGNNTINVGGNWSNLGGSFEAGTSTVVFYDASNISTVLGNSTFYNFTCITPGKTIIFEANTLTTIQNILTIQGQSEDYVTLLSSIGAKGSEFGIYINSVNDAIGNSYLDYIHVEYSIAYGPLVPIPCRHEQVSLDLNIGWDAVDTHTWTGAASINWDDAGNWSSTGGGVPTTGDSLIFPAGASNLSTNNNLTADTSFATITISGSGYILAGNSIIISSSMTDSVASGNNAISFNITFAATRTITVTNAAETLTISGVITGAGGMTKAGSGVLVLSNTNTYTGITTLSAGTLNFTNGALGSTGNITFTNGLLQYATGNTEDISSRIKNSTKLIYIDTNGNNVTFASIIDSTNTGGLTKTGTGALTLSAANTFTGNVTLINLADNTLNINNAQALGNAANRFYINGGVINNTSGSAITLVNYPMSWNNYFIFTGTNDLNFGTNTITLAGGGPGRGVNVVAGTLTIDNVITSGAAYNFYKDGAGILTLNGTNTFLALGVYIDAGTLNLNNAQALGVSTNPVRFYGGTVGNTSGSAITLVDYPLIMGGSSITFAGTQDLNFGNGDLVMYFGPRTITITVNANTFTLGGALGFGTGFPVVKSGGGTLVLTGTSTYTTASTISAGTVVFSNGSLGSGNIVFTGGTLQYAAGNTEDVSSRIRNSTSVININTNGNDVLFAGVINSSNSAGLVKSGSGALTLSGANTYTGGTTLSSGTLNINNNSALGTGTLTISGGTIDNTSGSSKTISNAIAWNADFIFTGTGDLVQQTGAVTMNASRQVTVSAGNLTINGIIGPASAYVLTKTGAGTLTLGGANTYTGGTTINAGTLSFANTSLSGSGNIVFTGGTLQYASGNTQDISSRIKNSSSTVNIDTNGNNVTFASVIDDTNTGGLTKSGTGTLTLSAVNTYTGTTTVSAGILALGTANSFSSGMVVVSSGATLSLAGYNLTSAGTTSFSVSGTLKLNGDELVTTPTFNAGSTVEYSATSGTRAIKDWIYTNATIKINGSGGTFTLPGVINCAGLNIAAGTLEQGTNIITVGALGITQSGGTFTGGSSTINCTGDFSLTGGTFISTSGTFFIAGNWTQTDGTFTHNSGTVDFNKGSGMQILTFGLDSFYNLAHSGAGVLQLSPSWLYSKQITIDKSVVSNIDQTDFPLLIYLASDTDLALNAQADGDDIAFVDSDGNRLSHEIERYTSATGELLVWVKIPTLSASSNTVIYMRYGNAACASQQNATAVWSNSYGSVWHLNSSSWIDSTSSANNGTGAGNVTTTSSGKIGIAASFDGSGDYIYDDSVTGLPSGNVSKTISAWFYLTSSNSLRNIGGFGNSASGNNFQIGQTTGSTFVVWGWGATKDWSTGVSTLSYLNAWHYVTVTYDGTNTILYLDGNQAAQTSAYTYNTNPVRVVIGEEIDKSGHSYAGKIDEFNIASINRGADWIKTAYNNQNNPSGSQTVGGQTANTLTIANNFTNSNGTLDANGVAVTATGLTTVSGGEYQAKTGTQTFNGGLTVSGGIFTCGASGVVDINGAFTLSSGTFTQATSTVNISGIVTISDGTTFTKATGGQALTLDGTASLTDSSTTKQDLGVVTIDGSAITTTLGSSIKATSITVGNDDTLNLGAGSYTLELTGTGTPLTVNGTFNKGTGSTVNYTGSGSATNVATVAYNNLTFTPTSATTYNLTGNLTGGNALSGNLTINSNATLDTTASNYAITLAGNWSNSGGFTANSGTVTFAGAGISNISGSTTFSNLTCTAAGKTLNFASGSTQTISGTLTLTGVDGNLITLGRSGGSGSDQWNINVSGISSVSYVSVSNSNATGNNISAAHSVSVVNNTNWSFDPSYLKITGSNAVTAGSNSVITITTYDQYGNIAASYNGNKTLLFSGANASLEPIVKPTCDDVDFGSLTEVNFSSGVATVDMKLYRAEDTSIHVTDGTFSSTGYDLDITVGVAAKNKLLWVTQPQISVQAQAVWQAFRIEITDAYGNRITANDMVSAVASAGTFGGTAQKAAINGLVTFDNITYPVGGSITVRGTSVGLTQTAASRIVTVAALPSPVDPSINDKPQVREAESVMFRPVFISEPIVIPSFISIGPQTVAVPIITIQAAPIAQAAAPAVIQPPAAPVSGAQQPQLEQSPAAQSLFEGVKAENILVNPIDPLVFSDVTGEAKVKVKFPGGQQIIPTYGAGVPLGAEKPMPAPAVSAKEKEE